MNNKHSGIRLHILVSGSIVLGMLVLAAAIIFHSYQSNRQILIDLAQENAQQIATKVDSQIERHTQPIITAIKLLSQDSLVVSNTHVVRMKRARLLKMVLDENPVLSSVYLGYQNGDFFLLRKLNNEASRKEVDAPANSQYMIQSIERDHKGKIQQTLWLYFDKGFNLLSRREVPEYRFDPRSRPWFAATIQSEKLYISEPYLFYTTKEVGVTLSIKSSLLNTVVGIDASINDLSDLMKSLVPDDYSRLALVNSSNQIIGYPNLNQLIHKTANGTFRLSRVTELNIPLFEQLVKNVSEKQLGDMNLLLPYNTSDGVWFGQKIKIGPQGGKDNQAYKENWNLLYGISEKALLARANQILHEQLMWSGVIILVLLVVGWFFGKLVTRPMLSLSEIIEGMKAFEFNSDQSVKSHIREVQILSQSLNDMSAAIKSFESISILLSQERDLDKMLNGVVSHLVQITSTEMAVIYLYDSEKEQLIQTTEGNLWGIESIDCPKEKQDDIVDICQKTFSDKGEPFVCIPLSDRRMSITGVLVLKLSPEAERNQVTPAFLKFVTQVSGSAATAVETRKQVEAQSALIDAIIRLLADAIDAKSPYTGGHCERVPMLAEMIIDEAQQEMSGFFAGFMMDDLQRQEFKIAAWLHDCGKITSREYVIDKATKLETIYNRIHEIRTRFEVVWRDQEINYWKGIAAGENTSDLEKTLQMAHNQIIDDFALLANLNIGGEAVQESDLTRLNQIRSVSWQRHFSRKIGLSRDELSRQPLEDEILPVTEQLIDNRPEHIIPWGDRKPPVEKDHPDNHWGFDMTLSENEMNLGEIYNLSIERGTLTEEERFLINEHIVQTIRMLSGLPFPEEMKQVPDIAGNHHEKVNGNGYPRKLTGEQLTIPEKVMALADVFEALTACDRPYKDAKTLSESLKILAFMVKDQHIDAEVFRLFIERGIYQTYADDYLADKQKDRVDVSKLYEIAGFEDLRI